MSKHHPLLARTLSKRMALYTSVSRATPSEKGAVLVQGGSDALPGQSCGGFDAGVDHAF